MSAQDWWAADLLDRHADDVVFATGGVEITHGHQRAKVAELDKTLQAHGIRPGSTVALHVLPSFTLLWVLFALWRRGAQVLLLDPRLKPAELERLLGLWEPEYSISFGGPGQIMVPFRPESSVVVTWRRTGKPARTEHCLVQISSGSTGAPKVIGRTAESMRAEIARFGEIEGMPRAGERVLLLNSLTHSLGLLGGAMHALSTGTVLVFSPRIGPRDLLTVLEQDKIDAMFGVPFHYQLLASLDDVPVLPNLRLAVSGGEPLPALVYERFRERFGLPIGQAYGMTEVGIIATDLAGTYPPPSVGMTAPGIKAREVDGALQIALDQSPYLTDEAAHLYTDGWLRTGDLCELADTGMLSVRGRIDSVVVVGGLKVDLTEVESVLRQHPSVHEAVVLHGGAIEAHVGMSEEITSDDLVRWCRERLSNHKVPKRFHISSAVPRTANGKAIRNPALLHAAYAAAPARH
jgi:acyl-coenzyme A synthetase/AMP-(fatty) acid ligase